MAKVYCIVCKKELTEESPGRVVGQMKGYASKTSILDYEALETTTFHDICEKEATKMIHKMNKDRLKRMGFIK